MGTLAVIPGTDGDPAGASAASRLPASPVGDLSTLEQAAARVADIAGQCNELLQYHRTICDAIELAAEEVQDQRITWSEAGASATVGELFVEFVVVSLLASPIAMGAISFAYRFVNRGAEAATRLASKSKALAALRTAESELAGNAGAALKLERAVAQAREEAEAVVDQAIGVISDPATTPAGRNFAKTLVAARKDEVARLEIELKSLRTSEAQRLRGALQQAEKAADEAEKQLAPEALEAFFKQRTEEVSDNARPGFNSGATSALGKQLEDSRRALRAFKPEAGSSRTQSASVQVRQRARAMLRDTELYFENVKEVAQLLYNQAAANRSQRPACVLQLARMQGVLRGGRNEAQSLSEVRDRVKLETEHTIWALLIGDKYEAFEPDSFDLYSPATLVTVIQDWLKAPPERVMRHLKDNYYPGNPDVSDSDVLLDLKKIRDGFDRGARERREAPVFSSQPLLLPAPRRPASSPPSPPGR